VDNYTKRTIYGKLQQYATKEEKIENFTADRINNVAKKRYREALLKRLEESHGDPKKAFTGKKRFKQNTYLY
jgi:CRISPR-associated endonuclease Csn1